MEMRKLLERLNDHCALSIEQAAALSATRADYEVNVEHVMVKLLETDARNDLACILQAFGLSPEPIWNGIMESISALRTGNPEKPSFSISLRCWLEHSWLLTKRHYGGDRIRGCALIDALFDISSPGGAPWRRHLEGIDRNALRSSVATALVQSVESPRSSARSGSGDSHGNPHIRGGSAMADASPDSGLRVFTTDLTTMAARGALDPVLGRTSEVRQLIDVLCRRRKNNPLLVGEAGVGKTAVVEALALRIAAGEVPESMKAVRIHVLDVGQLQAGASVKGEFERRLKQVIHEVQSSSHPVILFIDEVHTLMGAGGQAGIGDAANLLKPALARGEMRTIAATTWSEFKRYIERDPAFERRFQRVSVAEPSPEQALLMLSGLKDRLHEHQQVSITDDAVAAAVELSHRYIAGRQLPDKAVDLLDTAAARVRLGQELKHQNLERDEERVAYLERRVAALEADIARGTPLKRGLQASLHAQLETAKCEFSQCARRWERERELSQRVVSGVDIAAREALGELQGSRPMVHPEVDRAAVAAVVAEWTGIPLGHMFRHEVNVLLSLEERLAERVVGQEAALAKIAQTLRCAKAGLQKPDRPLGAFLLAGPSGVGKTECARALAEELFGGERQLVTINLSEYQEAHTVAQLKGAPPGYVGYGEGGVLTEAVRKRPYCVILLDEAEKAHPDVMNIFYQVFDRGMMRDAEGREIDFRNTVIVMTANLGYHGSSTLTEAHATDVGADETGMSPSVGEHAEAVRRDMLRYFAPALLNRLQIVPFRHLSLEVLRTILGIRLGGVADRLHTSHGITFRATEAVLDHLIGQAGHMDGGARWLEDLVQQRLFPEIARHLLGYIADDDMPDRLTLDLNTNGELECVFADDVSGNTAATA